MKYLVVAVIDADETDTPFNDDGFLNAIASSAERFGGQEKDSIIGTLITDMKQSVDAAFDAARGVLASEARA